MSFEYKYTNYFQNLLNIDDEDLKNDDVILDDENSKNENSKIDENDKNDEDKNKNDDDKNKNSEDKKEDKNSEDKDKDKDDKKEDEKDDKKDDKNIDENIKPIPIEINENSENKKENDKSLQGGNKKSKKTKLKAGENDSKKENEKIESTTNKINSFKSKCFYLNVDSREFNFIQSINDYPYSVITFTKDPIQIDMAHPPPKINLTNKGHVINTTEYFVNNKYPENFKPDEYRDLDSFENVDTRAEYNHLLNSYHNKLIYTNSKSNILTDNLNFIKSIKFLLSQSSQTHISEYSTFIKQFLETAANLRRHVESIKYIISPSSKNSISSETFSNPKNKRIDKFDLFLIPRDVIELINHISYYFKDIKDTLKLNSSTGYYELLVKNENSQKEQAIPIMCKHTFMTLNGESLYNISNECAFKGVCRYCGDTLESVSFEDTTTLPRNIAEFTYMLMELYGCSTDDQSVFIYIYNNIAALISQMVEKDDQNFDNKASSIAALFCYNVINNHPPISKPSNFLLLLSETLALVGFNEQKIKSTIDSGILGDTKNIYDVLTDTHDSKLYLNVMEDLFEKYASKDIKDVKSKGDEQMYLFNILYKQLRIDNLKIDEIVKGFKEKEREIEKGGIEPTRFNTLIVFEGYIKNCCPMNNNLNHEFDKNGGKCKKCGVNSDFKNYEEIYEKFETEFNISYDLKVENKFDVPKYSFTDISSIIKKNSAEAKEKIIRKFNISQNDFQLLCQHIMDDMSILIPTLQTWTHSNYDKWTVDEILNMIVYLNNEELYGMLWWENTNSSQYLVINAEDIDAEDVEDEDE